jgi:hypothetical protein
MSRAKRELGLGGPGCKIPGLADVSESSLVPGLTRELVAHGGKEFVVKVTKASDFTLWEVDYSLLATGSEVSDKIPRGDGLTKCLGKLSLRQALGFEAVLLNEVFKHGWS